METRTKVLGGLTMVGLLYAFTRPKMEIKVLKTDAALGMLQYYMKFYDFTITDTFLLGDEPNIVPVGDGKHLFLAMGNTTTGIVDLAIGYYTADGAFKAVLAKVANFDVAGVTGNTGRSYSLVSEGKVHLNDGEYLGTIQGYDVKLDNGVMFQCTTGLRNAFPISVKVEIKDKRAFVIILK